MSATLKTNSNMLAVNKWAEAEDASHAAMQSEMLAWD
jgi:hypothetical protein